MNVEVSEGEIQYINPDVTQGWNVNINKVNAKAINFSNRSALSESCYMGCTCHLYEGNAEMKAVLRPLEPNLTLNLDLNLIYNLFLLNDILKVWKS